jgi:hypothetical protein
MDCGSCAVCGNNKCEDTMKETCVNCPMDCGTCPVNSCGGVVVCGLGCIQFNMLPPQVDFTCLATCAAETCPSAQIFINQFFNCAIGALLTCGSPSCIMSVCANQLALCLASKC